MKIEDINGLNALTIFPQVKGCGYDVYGSEFKGAVAC